MLIKKSYVLFFSIMLILFSSIVLGAELNNIEDMARLIGKEKDDLKQHLAIKEDSSGPKDPLRLTLYADEEKNNIKVYFEQYPEIDPVEIKNLIFKEICDNNGNCTDKGLVDIDNTFNKNSSAFFEIENKKYIVNIEKLKNNYIAEKKSDGKYSFKSNYSLIMEGGLYITIEFVSNVKNQLILAYSKKESIFFESFPGPKDIYTYKQTEEIEEVKGVGGHKWANISGTFIPMESFLEICNENFQEKSMNFLNTINGSKYTLMNEAAFAEKIKMSKFFYTDKTTNKKIAITEDNINAFFKNLELTDKKKRLPEGDPIDYPAINTNPAESPVAKTKTTENPDYQEVRKDIKNLKEKEKVLQKTNKNIIEDVVKNNPLKNPLVPPSIKTTSTNSKLKDTLIKKSTKWIKKNKVKAFTGAAFIIGILGSGLNYRYFKKKFSTAAA